MRKDIPDIREMDSKNFSRLGVHIFPMVPFPDFAVSLENLKLFDKISQRVFVRFKFVSRSTEFSLTVTDVQSHGLPHDRTQSPIVETTHLKPRPLHLKDLDKGRQQSDVPGNRVL